jgi:hypothetical protein
MHISRKEGGLQAGYPIYGVSTPVPDVTTSQTLPQIPHISNRGAARSGPSTTLIPNVSTDIVSGFQRA